MITQKKLNPTKEADYQKIIFALIHAVFGVISVIILLITLSVVPDCVGRIRNQFLTFFVAQIILHLIFLIVATLDVTYLLAANINETSTDFLYFLPGYIILCCIATSAAIQLFSSIQRYINVIWSNLYLRISTKSVTFLIILGSFLFGINCFVQHYNQKRQLNYNLNYFRWLYNKNYIYQVNIFVLIALIVLFTLGIASIAQIYFDIRSNKKNKCVVGRGFYTRKIITILLYIFVDFLFFLLLTYCNKKANQIKEKNIQKHIGFIQIYLFGILPAIVQIINFDSYRRALIFRLHQLIGKSTMQNFALLQPNDADNNNFKVTIPIFKMKYKSRPFQENAKRRISSNILHSSSHPQKHRSNSNAQNAVPLQEKSCYTDNNRRISAA